MNQSPALQSPPPVKKSNKKGIVIGVIVLVLCGSCFVLAGMAAAGYCYFQNNNAGIGNIFKVLRIDFAWRGSYLDLPDAKKFAVKASFGFYF